MKCKLLLLCLLWMAAANNAWGGMLSKKVNVKCNVSEGLVYASEQEQDINKIVGWKSDYGIWENDSETKEDFWIYAKPNPGYRFKEWRIGGYNLDQYFSSEAKLRCYLNKTQGQVLFATFTEATDPFLSGVPDNFTVYVDGTKVKPDYHGNYTIDEGKTVRIEWSDDAVYGFGQGMAPGENEKFVEFTMPGNDLILPLISVEFPEGITEIKQQAFKGCSKLSSITIPNTVVKIGKEAFYGCSNLKTISIPTSVTVIEEYAFNIWGLTDLYYAGAKSQWNNITLEHFAIRNVVIVHYHCTATFNANGHGTAPAAQTKYNGEKATEPEPLREQGYDFGGWYTDADCNNEYQFDTPLDDNITLYAKWTAKANKITFNTGGKGTTPPDQTVYSGNKIREPNRQQIDNEYILCWCTDAALTKPYDFNKIVNCDMTLYAKWGYPSNVTINITNPEGGICTLTDGNGTAYGSGKIFPGIFKLTITPNDNNSFNGEYKLTKQQDGSSITPYQIAGSSSLVKEINIMLDYDLEINVTFSERPIVSIDVKTDGTTKGCSYTLKDKTKEYKNGDHLQNICYGVDWNPENDLVLTITKDNFICTGTIVNNNVETKITDKQITYSITPHGNVAISLFFFTPKNLYTSSLPAEGGTVTGGGIYDANVHTTLTATPNEGYMFVNWTIDGIEAGSEPSYQLIMDGDHNVVANFKEATHTVSVSSVPADGGTVRGGGIYDTDKFITLTATPTEGYRFVNWTFNGLNGGSEHNFPLIVDEDYTIVANFERVYPLSGQNVLFFPEGSFDPITEAAEGEQVTVSFNPECPPAGKYFGGAYSSNDVTPTSIGEYDAMFTMPAKAVNVDVVMNERQDLTVDLTANDPVDISFEVFTQLHRLEDNFHNDPNADKAYLDLNADGTDDLELDLVVNINGIEKVSIKKLAGGYASDWRFNFILTKDEFGFPYNGIIFDFGVRTPGDINSDGKVNIADVVELVNAMKLKPSARFNLLNADVNNDQDITQDDIDAVVDLILNKSN